ncbi:MAG: hypothetical protein ABIR27_00955 [Dokdonella sp.]
MHVVSPTHLTAWLARLVVSRERNQEADVLRNFQHPCIDAIDALLRLDQRPSLIDASVCKNGLRFVGGVLNDTPRP